MFMYGFELEGFYKINGSITLPPKLYPHDGFPGLCEVRSSGGKSILDAWFEVEKELLLYPFDTDTFEHTFTPKEYQAIRARSYVKEPMTVSNIYNKQTRLLGDKTLASLQINISNRVGTDSDKQAKYGLFDILPIVRRLDEVFAEDIKDSKRTPGWYSVKDNIRLEYRSLPNKTFRHYPVLTIVKMIEDAVNS